MVSDIQCRAEGETFYIRYNMGANIVLINQKHEKKKPNGPRNATRHRSQ